MMQVNVRDCEFATGGSFQLAVPGDGSVLPAATEGF